MTSIVHSSRSRRDPTQSDLTSAQRRLVALMQTVHFGRIERLAVHGGQPVFDPAPRIIRTLKIGGRNEPRPQASADDFAIKKEVVELVELIERIGDGQVARLEIAHGLPLVIELEDQLLA